jgi:hypothetical protein
MGTIAIDKISSVAESKQGRWQGPLIAANDFAVEWAYLRKRNRFFKALPAEFSLSELGEAGGTSMGKVVKAIYDFSADSCSREDAHRILDRALNTKQRADDAYVARMEAESARERIAINRKMKAAGKAV